MSLNRHLVESSMPQPPGGTGDERGSLRRDGLGTGADGTRVITRAPVRPRLAPSRHDAGFALTVLLERQPRPEEASILPLVTGGTLRVRLTVLPSDEALAALRQDAGGGALQLPACCDYALRLADRTLASVLVPGPSLRAELTVELKRDAAVEVLRAVLGQPSGCRVEGRAGFRRPSYVGAAADSELEWIARAASLREVFAEAPSRGVESSQLRVLCQTDAADRLEPLARKVTASRTRGAVPTSSSMVMRGAKLVALAAATQPRPRKPFSAAALVHSDAIQPVGGSGTGHWQLDDLQVAIAEAEQPGQRRHLPRFVSAQSLWVDHLSPDRFWYAPDFKLVRPDPAAPADQSSFQFIFRTLGHDAQGQPVIEASIRIALRAAMSPHAEQEWQGQGRPVANSVPMQGTAVELQLPYRASDGTSRTFSLRAASVDVQGGEVRAEFQVSNDWARLCYGLLAVDGYQTERARIALSYAFEAYEKLIKPPKLAWGRKGATTPVVHTQAQKQQVLGRPHVDVASRSLSLPMGETALRVGAAVARRPPTAGHKFDHGGLVIKPGFSPAKLPALAVYGIRTQGKTVTREVFFPCTTHGAVYLESAGDETRAVGCRKASELGEPNPRLYEPIEPELDGARPLAARVYRSLQVPGRFLVLPDRYTITRHEPDDEDAYRPAIYMYSAIDIEQPTLSECVVSATLMPDLARAEQHQLLDALRRGFHPDPVLELVTEVASEVTYGWALPDSGAEGLRIDTQVVKLVNGFQVALRTGIHGALQLRAMLSRGGVLGSASLALEDGTSLTTALDLDLSRISGPWLSDPLQFVRSAGTGSLTNRIGWPISVGTVFLGTLARTDRVLALDTRLAPGESAALGQVPEGLSVFPSYQVEADAADLEEVRSFIEEIHTNVVFLNLLDLAALQVDRLRVQSRIRGGATGREVELSSAQPIAEVDFILPLTSYLEDATLEFSVSTISSAGQQRAGAWQPWELGSRGNVVEIDAAMLEP